jgi:hypothetical protein
MSYLPGDYFATGVETERYIATKDDAKLKEFENSLPPDDLVLMSRAQVTNGESLPGGVELRFLFI